jgi:hypothetical protein
MNWQGGRTVSLILGILVILGGLAILAFLPPHVAAQGPGPGFVVPPGTAPFGAPLGAAPSGAAAPGTALPGAMPAGATQPGAGAPAGAPAGAAHPASSPAAAKPGTPAEDVSDSELAKFVTLNGTTLLVESPDHSTVWAYLGDSGRWAKLNLRPMAGEIPKVVKGEYVIIETEEAIYTFSKQAGIWSSLARKPGVKFAWIKRTDSMAIASMGSWIYVFSPKTCTWSTLDLLSQ